MAESSGHDPHPLEANELLSRQSLTLSRFTLQFDIEAPTGIEPAYLTVQLERLLTRPISSSGPYYMLPRQDSNLRMAL